MTSATSLKFFVKLSQMLLNLAVESALIYYWDINHPFMLAQK